MTTLGPICAFWREFDLDNKWRAKLDEVGLKIAELQEASTASRRALADNTKEWKRAAGEQGKVAAPLLKGYQEEIDSLTKRARHAEAAFLELYQELYEAPDPSHALSAALDAQTHTAQLEAQVRKLSSELAEYKAESKAIKNQDLTIRKQEEAIRELSAALEAKEEELAAARREAAAEADAAVVARMQAREAELADMLASTQSSLEAMQRLHTSAQNQLFELQARSEEAAAGKAAEWELAAEEVERAQERMAALEAEKQRLQQKLAEHAEEQATAAPASAVEETLRQELATQRDVAARLRSDLAAARRELQEASEAADLRSEALREQIEAGAARVGELQRELGLRPTQAQVEELKQQVRILQAVGYGAIDEAPGTSGGAGGPGEGEAAAGGVGGGGGGAGQGSLEGLLLAKNRRLEHELTMARLAAAEGEQRLDAAQSKLTELEAALAERDSLVRQLEEDAMVATGTAATAGAVVGGAGAAAGGGSAAGTASGAGLQRAASGAAMGSADGGGGGVGEDSVTRVLVGQRERLRARVAELEEQLASAKADAQAARQQLEGARADNVALVERLRYVGGYRQQAAARKDATARDLEAGDSSAGDVVGRYAAIYEDRINPFKEFQGQQHEQKRRAMGAADKAMYGVGQLVYQSPAARLAALVYLVVLHALVFGTLTHVSHRTSAHLMDHQQAALLDHSHAGRHDLTGMLTADGSVPAAASTAAGRLLRRLLSL